MTIDTKIKSLKRLLEKASEIKNEDSDDPDFKIWKNLVIRTLMKVFGDDSFAVKEFKTLRFFYNPMISYLGEDFSHQHLVHFRRDFETAKKFITSHIEELQEELRETASTEIKISNSISTINKVFISHSSADKEFVEEVI